jgi:twitching motility two-component system response regulator PilH
MGKTILVADDSPIELSVFINALRKNGYEAIPAIDGEDAIEKAQAQQPVLLICDVVMPKKNGFQVARHLKTQATTKAIKILLVSSKNQESDKFWGLKQGADEYLTKPFDEQSLLKAVARLI